MNVSHRDKKCNLTGFNGAPSNVDSRQNGKVVLRQRSSCSIGGSSMFQVFMDRSQYRAEGASAVSNTGIIVALMV